MNQQPTVFSNILRNESKVKNFLQSKVSNEYIFKKNTNVFQNDIYQINYLNFEFTNLELQKIILIQRFYKKRFFI